MREFACIKWGTSNRQTIKDGFNITPHKNDHSRQKDNISWPCGGINYIACVFFFFFFRLFEMPVIK